MNIEDAIEILKDNIKSLEGNTPFKHTNYKKVQAIETLLTDYEKEKKKNKKLDKENQGLFELYNFNDSSLLAKILKDYKGIIEKQQKEIEELKENNGYHLGFIDGGIVKRYEMEDKIKAKIEELNNPESELFKSLFNTNEPTWSVTIQRVLQSLLEKE